MSVDKSEIKTHKPYTGSEGGPVNLQHLCLVDSTLALVDGKSCPLVPPLSPSQASSMSAAVSTFVVGQTSDAVDGGAIAAAVSFVTGVPFLGYTETEGRFVVHVPFPDLNQRVCPWGNWTMHYTHHRWELAVDRPEFWTMHSGTLKSLIEYHYGPVGDVVEKKTRMVKVLVAREDEKRFLSAIQASLMLQDRDGWFWVATTDVGKYFLDSYVRAVQRNAALYDVLRHQALPKNMVNVERARR